MTNEVQARQALVQAVEDFLASPGFAAATPVGRLDITAENGPSADLDTVDFVLNYQVNFLDSDQIEIGENPRDRTTGNLAFVFGAKKGQGGDVALLTMRSAIRTAFKAQHLDGVHTLIPVPGADHQQVGWVFKRLKVPFYFDSG